MNIEKEVKLLKLYTLISTLAVITLFILVYFSPQVNSTKFQEIDVERINVVEKDGQLRMVEAEGD